MVVTCIANSCRHSPKIFESVGFSEKAAYQVTPGNEYVVHAMALLGLHLVVLLRDDTGQPSWFPASQFRIANPHLDAGWGYDITRRDARGLCAIWGYGKMIADKRHNDALIAKEPEAVRLFAEAASRMPLETAMTL